MYPGSMIVPDSSVRPVVAGRGRSGVDLLRVVISTPASLGVDATP